LYIKRLIEGGLEGLMDLDWWAACENDAVAAAAAGLFVCL
jgi:hypothetical protein